MTAVFLKSVPVCVVCVGDWQENAEARDCNARDCSALNIVGEIDDTNGMEEERKCNMWLLYSFYIRVEWPMGLGV